MGKQKAKMGLGAAVATLLIYTAPAIANVQVWNFNSSDSFSTNTWGNSLTMNTDGIQLVVTGWSDTLVQPGPDGIQTARLNWASTNGLGVQNRAEGTGSPSHAVDSFAVTPGVDGEFDMLLLEFDTAVNLTSLQLNWAQGGTSSNTTDISILAWNGVDSAALAGQTWSSILAGNGGGYEVVGNYSNVGLSYYSVNPSSITSTTWLLGAYNPVFGSGGSARNDAFKLTSLKTVTPPPTEVPVPGTLPLVLLALLGLRARGIAARSKPA